MPYEVHLHGNISVYCLVSVLSRSCKLPFQIILITQQMQGTLSEGCMTEMLLLERKHHLCIIDFENLERSTLGMLALLIKGAQHIRFTAPVPASGSAAQPGEPSAAAEASTGAHAASHPTAGAPAHSRASPGAFTCKWACQGGLSIFSRCLSA